MVDLIAERWLCGAGLAAQEEPGRGERALAHQRVIDKVKFQARQRGLPAEMIDMVGAQWRNMIGWFVQYEEEKLRQQEASSGGRRE